MNSQQCQTRFDSDVRPHINLVCLRCGGIRDWEDPSLPDIIAKVAALTNFTATGQSLDIYGICQGCERKAKLVAAKASIQA